MTTPEPREYAVDTEYLIPYENTDAPLRVGSYVLTKGGTTGRMRIVGFNGRHAIIVDDPYNWEEA